MNHILNLDETLSESLAPYPNPSQKPQYLRFPNFKPFFPSAIPSSPPPSDCLPQLCLCACIAEMNIIFTELIWRRLITSQLPLSSHGVSMAVPPFPSFAKPHIQSPNFCTEIATTPPDRGVVTEFLLNKCGLTDKDITKAFRHKEDLLRRKSIQNAEEVLQLLNGCGLTTPAQIRTVVLCFPKVLFLRAERNIKPKLSLLRTFVKEEDITKLVSYSTIFSVREENLTYAISLLQRLGIEGEALSKSLARWPRLLTSSASEEKVRETVNRLEHFGFKKGSKMFPIAFCEIFELTKETIDRKLQCLTSLGFLDEQISEAIRRGPWILRLSEENMKGHVDFLVKSAGLTFADFVKYTALFGYSLEKRIIPRYRVMEALKTEMIPPNCFNLTEECFLERYVNKNAESSVLRDIYLGAKETCSEKDIEEETCNEKDVGSTLGAVDHCMKAGKETRNEA